MMESYTFMNCRKFDYQWTIKNFPLYLNFTSKNQNQNESQIITSAMFDIYAHKDCKFYLTIKLSMDYFQCSFQLEPFTASLKFKCELSISNTKNNNPKRYNMTCYRDIDNNIKKLPIIFNITKGTWDNWNNTFNLSPGDDLRVVCSLTLFSESTSISQIPIPKHYPSLNDHFKKLLDSQVGSDVIFEVDGKELNFHKSILMARSLVFSAMFNNDMIEKRSNRVKIEDMSLLIFELMIHFIYTDELKIKLNLETGMDLLRAASKYQLERLEALCEAELFRLLTINNAIDILLIAERHSLVGLVENTKKFVKTYQTEIQKIVKSEHILKHPHHLSLFFTN